MNNNKPWIAHVLAIIGWLSVVVGTYLAAIVEAFADLDTGVLMGAAGILTGGSVAYGYNSSRVKTKELEQGRSYSSLVARSDDEV